MDKCAMYHKAKSAYAYAYDQETLHIKLRTKKDDITTVTLICGDPFDFTDNGTSGNLAQARYEWNIMKVPMEKIGGDELFDFWGVMVKPGWRRLKYAFLVQDNQQMALYGEKKIVDIEDAQRDHELYNQPNFFAFPFLNGIDVYQAPAWVKDTVWYQIFPERFANGDLTNDPVDVRPWGSPVKTSHDHFGGDIQGIIDHLDYLVDLGINGIYLTPVFQAPSNHKYDTIDYLEVDTQFGNNKLLKDLVAACHERGIRVMFDVVFNHCGFYFNEFQDVLKNGELSRFKDWFHIRKFPLIEGDDFSWYNKKLNFDTFAFTPMMPKLNTENPKVKEMLLNVVKYWAETVEVDAWRLDVCNEVDHHFWRSFRDTVKAVNKDAFILGEIWHDASPWVMGDQLDSVMNYPLYEAMMGFFAKDTLDAKQFGYAIDAANFNYADTVNQNMYNLLSSHDTARFLNKTGENLNRLKLAYTFLMTLAGAPAIYYGDEIGMTGGDDPDNRRCMIWEAQQQNLKLFEFMKQLIGIRKKHSALGSQGDFHWLTPEGSSDVLVYRRMLGQKKYYVLLNRSKNEQSVMLPVELQNQVFESLMDIDFVKFNKVINLSAYGYMILQRIG